LQEKQF